MFKVLQVQLDDQKVNEVNSRGWEDVEWGGVYHTLTWGDFAKSDTPLTDIIDDAIKHGLIQHTMDIDVADENSAFNIGNGYGDITLLKEHMPHKSMSIGDILIDVKTGTGMIVARFGFISLTKADVHHIVFALFASN